MKKIVAFFGVLLLLTGCSRETAKDTSIAQTPAKDISIQTDTTDLFSNRDYQTDYENYATISLAGTTASCDSDAVQIDGSTVTITDEGTYVLTGSFDDGQIIVSADKTDKTQLVLDGVDIHSETSAPIYILQADKVFLTLQGENHLSNGGSFEAIDENSIDSVIFSKEDLSLNGTGGLSIASPAGHGIVSKDELTVTGGVYEITTASHGMTGKDNICIDGGSFQIAAGKDGIHAENSDDETLGFVFIQSGDFTVSAEGDGISAGAWMEIQGGTYDITTGGGSENGQTQQSENWGGMGGRPGGMMPGGMGGRPGRTMEFQTATDDASEDSTSIKGIKAGGDLVISGGTFTIDSADDGIHSNSNLSVSGGSFSVATGDDGFHADNTLQITDGDVEITESYEGLEGLHILFSGGTVNLTATDDGLNAAGGTDQSGMGGRDQFGRPGGGMGGGMGAGNGSITISGGSLQVNASGDGIDANGSLLITGGNTVVSGPTQGDTATLDYDTSATITGGTFIGTGASGMAQTFSESQQGVIALSMGGSVSAGTTITITEEDGKQLLSHAPELNFAVLIVSTPDMVKGESYTVTVGELSGTFEAE